MMETQLNYAEILAFIASKIKGKKLENLKYYEIPQKLETLSTYLGLTQMQTLLLIPIFNATCKNDTANVGDIAEYYELANLDIMAHAEDLEALRAKNYIIDEEATMLVKELNETEFKINDELRNAILHNKEIPNIQTHQKSYNQIDFVNNIEMILDNDSRSTNKKVISSVLKIEKAYSSDIQFVKNVIELCPNIIDRIVFYYCCNEFSSFKIRYNKDLNEILEQIFSNPSMRFEYLETIIQKTSPLIQHDLVVAWKNLGLSYNIALSDEGKSFFLQELNETFGPKQAMLNNFEFVKAVQKYIDTRDEEDRPTSYIKSSTRNLEKNNSQLPLVENIKTTLDDIDDRILFYSICESFSRGNDITMRYLLRTIFDDPQQILMSRNQFKTKTHPLCKQKLVEIEDANFFGDNDISLTEEGKKLFLGAEYEQFEEQSINAKCRQPQDIKPKTLYYDPALQDQISLFQNSLFENNFTDLQRRLSDQALPTGVAALFYGTPGTGKTESVYQIAKATGRAVYQVDISEMKTCWYGESQKLVRGVFNEYKKMCRKSKNAPILLFNEADAIFGRRFENANHSVDQTENAIQNIILEEMEKLEGILIATTNLETNLDPAFERRFLFKLKFEKPSLRSKLSIWKDKIADLSELDATELATAYDFSGGEIDNIVRKITMTKLINNKEISLEDIHAMCQNERLNKKNNNKIGY